MTVRRVVLNIGSVELEASRTFYIDVPEFEVAIDMRWIVTFASPESRTTRISIIRPYAVTTPQPDLTGEVTEVAATHARALAHGHAVVCPLTDEPWGVWRFFLRDPNGKIVNIMRYQTGR